MKIRIKQDGARIKGIEELGKMFEKTKQIKGEDLNKLLESLKWKA